MHIYLPPLLRTIGFALGLSIATTAANAQTPSEMAKAPIYTSNAADPTQENYSVMLLGFAFDTKCHVLKQADHDTYELHLNTFTYYFRHYLLTHDLTRSQKKAVRYTEEMAMGAIRFAATQPCDNIAEERISMGQELARNAYEYQD